MNKKLLDRNIMMKPEGPRPAAYEIKTTIGVTDPTVKRNPAYTIQGKYKHKTVELSPGPIYDTTGLTRYGVDRPTGGTMGHPFRTPNPAPTPGPADYCVPGYRSTKGPKMRPAVNKRRNDPPTTPAPNAYCLPDTRNKRGTRMAAELFPVKTVKPSPGPGQYKLPDCDVYKPGRCRNGPTMGKRFEEWMKEPTPGPADYDGRALPRCDFRRCTASTFGTRWNKSAIRVILPTDNA